MKSKHKKGSKLQKGITLIALVITIIVLLILAGVSIATLTGDNGILTKAQIAKKETEKANEEEQIRLAQLNATMNTQGYKYDTEDGQKVPIPAGFAPTQIEGENSVENGLVIVDSNGNEFVWIPVNESEYEIDTSFDNNLNGNELTYIPNYLPEGIENSESNNEEEIEKELVTKEGINGFYISRYEAGDEAVSKDRTSDSEYGKLVSKKGTYPYNWVSQDEANEIAKEYVNNDSVKSGLITGRQWDAVMKFIQKKERYDGIGNIYDVKKYDNSRHLGGWRETGKNPADMVCNIYDLEGSCLEWTTERVKISGYNMIFRGGCDGNDETALRCASYRKCKNYGYEWHAIGFRFVLYVIN